MTSTEAEPPVGYVCFHRSLVTVVRIQPFLVRGIYKWSNTLALGCCIRVALLPSVKPRVTPRFTKRRAFRMVDFHSPAVLALDSCAYTCPFGLPL